MFVSFQRTSANRKLAPTSVEVLPDGRRRNVPLGPFCSSTYASIVATCPDTCSWKDNGCYAQAGGAGWSLARLDRAARVHRPDGLGVMVQEADLMRDSWQGTIRQDGAKGGRDLRLHVSGDVSCADGAEVLAAAADEWYSRAGGDVWTFTHRWAEIGVHHWGGINTLASVDTPEEAEAAIAAGYTPALVVSHHASDRAYQVGSLKLLPCPAQTRGRTCVECRLCLDATLPKGTVIAFAAHGRDQGSVKESLVQLRLF